jgi:hypothetical protein
MRHGQDRPAARIRRADPPPARVRWLRAGTAPGAAAPGLVRLGAPWAAL